jgi:hypothetical protein
MVNFPYHPQSAVFTYSHEETFPACHRCLSTGRICDGYGAWGGGSNGQEGLASKDYRIAPKPKPLVSISLLVTSTEDKYYFEWFKCRTAKKIPGLFVLPFWDTLLFQACLNEPAVFNAVLTLSSIHKNGNSKRRIHDSPDEQEQFTLSHYSKAISYLRPHFSNKDRSSVRVALITCIVFVCLEFFRGHFKTAQTHLQNGLNVFREMQTPSRITDDGVLFLDASRESIDDWILEALSRLQIQVALFNQNYQRPVLNLQASGLELPLPIFCSFNEAWIQLEQIFYKVLYLTKQSREQRVSEKRSLVAPITLLERQQRIKVELAQWCSIHELSRKEVRARLAPEYQGFEEFGFRLLNAYHFMANIMAGACLYSDDEAIYDSFTEQFVCLMEQLVFNWSIRSLGVDVRTKAGPHVDLSRSVVDIGWIPPLYYTAIKCRSHRLRLQAIRLLECSTHREGIWDARIAACVARKVMKIEERDFYSDIGTADDFPITSSPALGDQALLTLPLSYRIHEVKVDLPNSPTESFFLSYRQKQNGDKWKVFAKEFSVVRQCWMDE